MASLSTKELKNVMLKAHKLLVIDSNASDAISYLIDYLEDKSPKPLAIIHWLAMCYLESGKYEEAKDIYLSFNANYQAGYCNILRGNLEEAKKCWVNCSQSEVKHWSRCLETMLLGHIDFIPTFLNIRNHLETDLGYLLRAKQEYFCNNIMRLADDLIQINLESYKFIGRSLLNNGYEHVSVNYLLKSRDILPNDPEIYYHLGQYSLQVGAISEAETMFNHCLLISPSYSPASDRLKEIKHTLS